MNDTIAYRIYELRSQAGKSGSREEDHEFAEGIVQAGRGNDCLKALNNLPVPGINGKKTSK